MRRYDDHRAGAEREACSGPGSLLPRLALVMLAIPAIAHAQAGGTAGGPPGGFPGERADTGASAGTLDYIHDLEKFVLEKSGSPEAQEFARRAAAFLTASSGRRKDAFALGMAAQRGERIEIPAATLRKELEADLIDWRDAFGVPAREYRTIREQLVSDGRVLTAAQWAIRRAGWFQARDQWIEKRKQDLGITA